MECLSYAPQATKTAMATLEGPQQIFLEVASQTYSHFGGASFLLDMGRGAIKVSHLLVGIERRQYLQELTYCLAVGFSLDYIAL